MVKLIQLTIWCLLVHLSTASTFEQSSRLLWRRLNIPVATNLLHVAYHIDFKSDCAEDDLDCDWAFYCALISPLVKVCEESQDDSDESMPERTRSKPNLIAHLTKIHELKMRDYSKKIHTKTKFASKLQDANLNADFEQLHRAIGDPSEERSNVTDFVPHVLEFSKLMRHVARFIQAIRNGQISEDAIQAWTGFKPVGLSLLADRPVCYFNAASQVLTVGARVIVPDQRLSLLSPDHFTWFNMFNCSITAESPKVVLFNQATHDFCPVDASLEQLQTEGYYPNQPCSSTSTAPSIVKTNCSQNAASESKIQVKRLNDHYRVYCYPSEIRIKGTCYACPNVVFRISLNTGFSVNGIFYHKYRAE